MNVRRILSLVFVLFVSVALFPQEITVAVLDFENHTGSQGMAYLSEALPESISATLAQMDDIQVVERRQLGKVLEEIELEMSGIVDERNVARVGALARADVLLLGSFTGNPNSIVLTLKAVEVQTAGMLYGRIITSPLGELFDATNIATRVFAAVIAGKDIGTLSVITSPEECDVYIDGMLVGKSPVVEYKLPVGSHRVRVIKSGFTQEETTVQIERNQHSQWNPTLAESQRKFPWMAGGGLMYLVPINTELPLGTVAPSLMGYLTVGYTFDIWTITGEYAYSRQDHSESVSFFGEPVTQTRWYNYHSLRVNFLLAPFPELRTIAPFFGAFVGGSILNDNRENSSFENDTELLGNQILLIVGGKVGAVLFPLFRVQPFVEIQFYYHPTSASREEFESQGLAGGLAGTTREFTAYGLALGGGVRVKF